MLSEVVGFGANLALRKGTTTKFNDGGGKIKKIVKEGYQAADGKVTGSVNPELP